MCGGTYRGGTRLDSALGALVGVVERHVFCVFDVSCVLKIVLVQGEDLVYDAPLGLFHTICVSELKKVAGSRSSRLRHWQ